MAGLTKLQYIELSNNKVSDLKPLGGLSLIVRVLGREAKNVRDAKRSQLCIVVAEAAGLRRAAASARDVVPARRQVDSRNARCRGRCGRPRMRH